MPEFSGKFFKTFQTVAVYNNALLRHGQFVRWTKAMLCPCLDQDTNQPDPQCTICKGRGRIFSVPGNFRINWEMCAHDNLGRIFPKINRFASVSNISGAYSPIDSYIPGTYVPGTAHVWHQSTELVLDVNQPVDNSYIQLAPPWPAEWQRLRMTYECTPIKTMIGENCAVIAPNVLMSVASNFKFGGTSTLVAGNYTSSIASVSRVYNVTRNEAYTVSSFQKNFIYLSSMGNWQSGDVLECDFTYVYPYLFLLSGVSPKLRYNQAFILDEANMLLATQYFYRVGKDDLITAQSEEHYGDAIIDPAASGTATDTIRNYFDISRLTAIVDLNGTFYDINNVVITGRNQITWLIAKPTTKYTVQFYYNPTYVAMKEFPSMRAAENKEYVNRMNLMQYDALSSKVVF